MPWGNLCPTGGNKTQRRGIVPSEFSQPREIGGPGLLHAFKPEQPTLHAFRDGQLLFQSCCQWRVVRHHHRSQTRPIWRNAFARLHNVVRRNPCRLAMFTNEEPNRQTSADGDRYSSYLKNSLHSKCE